MIFGTQLAAHRIRLEVRLGLILIVLAALIPLPVNSQSKAPRKSPAPAAPQPKEDPLAALIQQAKDALDKNDFAAAVDPLQKFIAQRPDDPYTHFQLGYAYAGLKRQEEAKTEFSRAIALDPKMAPAHLNLGLVLMDTDPGAAAEAFRHAAELQPTESRPLFLSGFAYERASKFTEATEQYRAALALSPKDYESQFALGRVLLRNGNAAEAEGHFREAIAVRNDSPTAHLGLADSLLTQKKYEAGSDALADYLKLNPGDRAARFDRVSALLELDHYDDALAELDRAEAGSAPTLEHIKMRGDIYLHLKKWRESSDALTQAVAQSPQDPELLAWLGHVKVELREYPVAINLLGKANSLDPKNPDALRDLVSAFFLSEDYPATIGAMDRLSKMEPLKPASWFVRAICYDKLGHKTEAIDAYQKFLDQDNGQNDIQDFQARRRILTLQSEMGQSPKKPKR